MLGPSPALVESLLGDAAPTGQHGQRCQVWTVFRFLCLLIGFVVTALLSSEPYSRGLGPYSRGGSAFQEPASTIAAATVVPWRPWAHGPRAFRRQAQIPPLPPLLQQQQSPRPQRWTSMQVSSAPAVEIEEHKEAATNADLLGDLSSLVAKDAELGPAALSAQHEKTSVRFSHVHVYCDRLRRLDEYKLLEQKLNGFAEKIGSIASGAGGDVAAGRKTWHAMGGEHDEPIVAFKDPESFKPSGQDLVEQLLVGLGWRITGKCQAPSTQTFVVSSPDLEGVQIVFTSHAECGMDAVAQESVEEPEACKEDLDHFGTGQLQRFGKHQSGRQGIAVLGFEVSVGGVDAIRAKYAEHHPNLLVPGPPRAYADAKVLEVFAYYRGQTGESDADVGTILRFVEPFCKNSDFWVLPGVERVEAVFDGKSLPAYCDHWVSNVVSRTGFIDTLSDTLGFAPKVDFNAGVVAAGEAQIESTVTGNDPRAATVDKDAGLRDQSQVYLPINNAISEVGHVYWYLEEIGQGIQHIASRVENLPAVVQRANDYRKMTGAGLSFLSIPRSYYGVLTSKRLSKDAGIDLPTAELCISALQQANLLDASDIVDLEATKESILQSLPHGVPESVVVHVLRARYGNMYSLLRDQISEETYLAIVRNNILVDVQGDDLLMQIFTTNVLQRRSGEEAPFLEFIQRVCSEKVDPVTGQRRPIKPGCGGFGIRNFLTLFLSIEVSKASKDRASALREGDEAAAQYYGKVVSLFAAQLDESNPVLTAISDAMTAEGEASESGDLESKQHWRAVKARENNKLKELSEKYRKMMKALREQAPQAQ